jgi:dTDP-4-dehydrorhamnose reductase
MKILITGTSGFLGRRAAASFKSNGYEVLTPSHAQLELCDGAAVLRYLEENRPDGVIHCAAVSDTGKCQQDPEGSARVNVDAPANLAAACARTGAKLVFCSSDQVYSGSRVPGPHREDEPVTPNNVYGGQKLRAEGSCLAIAPDTVCLRLSWMYSTDSYPGEHGHFLTVLRESLADPDRPLAWPIHDRRGLTDVRYVLENLPGALEIPGGVYNFGSENRENTYDTLRNVLSVPGMEAALSRLVPNREAFGDDPRDISMDLSRTAAAGLSFPSTVEGLRRAMKAIQEECT